MRSNRTVVLTGFEPFADFSVNPSWEAARSFDGEKVDSFQVRSFQIPLKYAEIKPTIAGIIERERPAALISLGQSYRSLFSLEKVAINYADLTDSAILYNCGTRPEDERLEPKAPAGYFTTLPIRRILDKLRQNGIPAEISYTAGTFGCNQAFFHAMHMIDSEGLETCAGFVHIPCLPSQAAQLQKMKKGKVPSMSLETTTKALKVIIETTLEHIEESDI